MKLYIAASSRTAASNVMKRLQDEGHVVTSRWIESDTPFHVGSRHYDCNRSEWSVNDEEDVRAATDGLVSISEPDGTMVPGGKHVETGIAIALGRPVFVVGCRENIFHWHPLVSVVADIESLVSLLNGGVKL